jgi:hypothetical protein
MTLRLNWISPGRYPVVSGPPYTRSSKPPTNARNGATEPSHHQSASPGSHPGRSRCTARTATTAHPSTTTSVYLVNVAASRATNPSSPTIVRRLAVACIASTAHSNAPQPAAISEASVNVGM